MFQRFHLVRHKIVYSRCCVVASLFRAPKRRRGKKTKPKSHRSALVSSLLERKEPGRIPVAILRRTETLIEEPLQCLVQVRQHAGQRVVLVRVHLMPERDALIDQRSGQHQRVLLMHQRIGGAVHQEEIPSVQIAGPHRQIGLLQRSHSIGRRRHVAIGEEGACTER